MSETTVRRLRSGERNPLRSMRAFIRTTMRTADAGDPDDDGSGCGTGRFRPAKPGTQPIKVVKADDPGTHTVNECLF